MTETPRITEHEQVIAGARIAWREAGDPDAPVLLLVHGLIEDSRTWNAVIPALAEHHRVIAPDLLGHGGSARPRRGDYSPPALATHLRDLLLVLGLTLLLIAWWLRRRGRPGLDPAARDDMLALVQRIGHDFGIPVLVTSHLLGELERISDHVVVLDGGRLLRSEATQAFLADTGVVLVEVLGEDDAQTRMGEALAARGLVWRPRGTMIEIDPVEVEGTADDEAAAALAHDRLRDLVRDAAADLVVGLVRLQPQTGRLEDVFREEVPA